MTPRTERGAAGAVAVATRTALARSALIVVVSVLALVLALPGCRIGGSGASFENENDRLRAERAELRRLVDDLEEQLARRVEQVEALRTLRQAQAKAHGRAATQPSSNGVTGSGAAGGDSEGESGSDSGGIGMVAHGPVLSALSFGGLSGPIDADQDGVDDEYRAYVLPRDQYGRFLPAEASATLQLVRIDASGKITELARVALDETAFREAYRSNVTGTHFSLKLPLGGIERDADAAADGADAPVAQPIEVTVKLTVTDAATGHRLEASQSETLRLR